MVPLDVPLDTVLPRRTVLPRPDLLRPKKFRTISSPPSYPFRSVLYRTRKLPLPCSQSIVLTRAQTHSWTELRTYLQTESQVTPASKRTANKGGKVETYNGLRPELASAVTDERGVVPIGVLRAR